MTSERDLADKFYRNDFGAFTYEAFKALTRISHSAVDLGVTGREGMGEHMRKVAVVD